MNRYNPKGLRRDHRGRLLDKWGREMEVDWDEFKRKRLKPGDRLQSPKVLNPMQAAATPKRTAESIVDNLLEGGPDDLADPMYYASTTPAYIANKQAEVERGLVKLGFHKLKKTRRNAEVFGPEVVSYLLMHHLNGHIGLTRTMNGIGGASTADPIWAVDAYTDRLDHAHAAETPAAPQAVAVAA